MSRPRCPVCGTSSALRIRYGLPTPEAVDDPGSVLGGCIVQEGAPRYRCRNGRCRAEFG